MTTDVDHLSYSGLSSFLRCGRHFYYSRVERMQHPVAYWLFLGQTVHKALQVHYRGILDEDRKSEEEVLGFYADAFDERLFLSEWATGIDWKDQAEGPMKDLGIVLLRRYLRSPHSQFEPLQVEFEWEREVGGVPTVGRIDVIDAKGRLIDFKVTKREKSQEAADDDLQPTFYAMGMGGPITFSYHFVLKHVDPEIEVVHTTRSRADVAWLEEEILPTAWETIQAGMFQPCDTGHWLCAPKYCEFWGNCRGSGDIFAIER